MPEVLSSKRAEPGPSTLRRLTSRLLRFPLPFKILGANGALVAGTALLAVLLARIQHDPVFAAGLAAGVGLAVCVPINWILVRWALSPLSGLQRTAERVHAGDLEARAPRSLMADPGMRRLIQVFNDMLQRLVLGQRVLRRLSVGVLEAAERERRSLAAELQDDTAQRLAALLLRVELARKAVDLEPSCVEGARHLERLRDETAESLELVRRLARRLHPPELGELGLVPALRAHARAVSDQAGLPVEFEVKGPEPELEQEVALAMYRVAEEALVNAVRHADAGRIRLELETGDGSVTLNVVDDGRGFEPELESTNGGGGLGLLGMRERARSVGGSLAVVSGPGAGARVIVSVPARSERPSTTD
jgi:two-component system sensor histidine kinase UhpB